MYLGELAGQAAVRQHILIQYTALPLPSIKKLACALAGGAASLALPLASHCALQTSPVSISRFACSSLPPAL